MTDKKINDNMSEENQTLHEKELKKVTEESPAQKEETQPAEPEKKEELSK